MTRGAGLVLCSWLALGLGARALGAELPVLSDKGLAQFISDLEHVATSPSGLPLRVKIFSAFEGGECDGTPESCPKTRVYVSVSTYDEAPDYQVYELPAAFGWRFEKWGPPPESSASSAKIVIFMQRKVLSAAPEKGWFAEERVRLAVSPTEGTLEVIERKDSAPN